MCRERGDNMIHLADTKEKRKAIQQLIKLRKEQLRIFEEGLIKPLKDNIRIAESCIKQKESLERLQIHSQRIREHIAKMYEVGGE